MKTEKAISALTTKGVCGGGGGGVCHELVSSRCMGRRHKKMLQIVRKTFDLAVSSADNLQSSWKMKAGGGGGRK